MSRVGPQAALGSIAFRAGMSTGLLTHYFPRKVDLQLALLLLLQDEGMFARDRQRRRELLPPTAHLRRIISDTFPDQRPVRWELFIELARPTMPDDVRIPIALRRRAEVTEIGRVVAALLSDAERAGDGTDHSAIAERILRAFEAIGLRAVCTVDERPTRTACLIEARRAVERELRWSREPTLAG
jgi:AcrR family transcriptional regulator